MAEIKSYSSDKEHNPKPRVVESLEFIAVMRIQQKHSIDPRRREFTTVPFMSLPADDDGVRSLQKKGKEWRMSRPVIDLLMNERANGRLMRGWWLNEMKNEFVWRGNHFEDKFFEVVRLRLTQRINSSAAVDVLP